MQLTVNGGKYVSAAKSLADLIVELKADPASVVIVLNDMIVPVDKRATTVPVEGDCVEVLMFVAGG